MYNYVLTVVCSWSYSMGVFYSIKEKIPTSLLIFIKYFKKKINRINSLERDIQLLLSNEISLL